ncbi:arylsulfatase [Candidatus Latescibacterota bacterium]
MKITRREAIKILGIGASSLTAAPPISYGAQSSELPNIVLILADDMGYGDLACQNPASKIPTPHLDRLAQDGIRFNDAHSPSAVCTPTRYGLLTGRYCWRTRLKESVLWCWDSPLIESNRLTVGSMLKSRGYDTACIGKWHLGMDWPTKDDGPPLGMGETNNPESGTNVDFTKPIANGPTTRGFDYYYGTAVPNFPPYCFIENEHTVGIPTTMKPDSMFGCPGPMLDGWKLEAILPGLMNKAVGYIDARGGRSQNRNFRQTQDKPFFLYMPLTAPHTPIAPTDEFTGKSRAGAYGDFVHQVDHIVGEVLKALDRNGFGDDTLVIFTSDNGSPCRNGVDMNGPLNSVLDYGHNPSHIYSGIKSDIWDGGHRVPFIARWNGCIQPNTVSVETVCLVDFMATCAAIVGKKLPEDAGEDSYNILPALTGQKTERPIREATVHHSFDGMFAIRKGKWKLILGRGSGGWSSTGKETDPPKQLYDMVKDPSEQYNMYNERPDIVENLSTLLKKYQSEGRSAPVISNM